MRGMAVPIYGFLNEVELAVNRAQLGESVSWNYAVCGSFAGFMILRIRSVFIFLVLFFKDQ